MKYIFDIPDNVDYGVLTCRTSNGYYEYNFDGADLEQLPPAQLGTNLAEVGTDCISRQAAIDYFVINVGFHDEDGYPIEDTDELRKIWTEYFDEIPSAEPKKIRGQWSIKGQAIDTVRGYWAKCSACGHSAFGGGNYCSNCGSYNKGEVTT